MVTSQVSHRPRPAGASALCVLGLVALVGGDAWAAPRCYVRVVEVLGIEDAAIATMARELLEKELARRELFVTDLGDAPISAASLEARRLRGYDVSLRFEHLTKEFKEPRPGRSLKQLAMGARVSVFGSSLSDKKLAFSGEGESLQIVEVDERRLEKETAGLLADVLADAVTQAVDQAVLKLSLPSQVSHAKPKHPRTNPPVSKPPRTKSGASHSR